MKNEFMDSDFEIQDYYPYLEKPKVQFSKKVEIVGVNESHKKNRPIFIGKFSFGTYKFDLCVEEMLRFVEIYGNKPKEWIGVKMEIKANPITINRRNALRLCFTPMS